MTSQGVILLVLLLYCSLSVLVHGSNCGPSCNGIDDHFIKDCPSGCSGHGSCGDDGKCQCDDGWAGPSCSYTIFHLHRDEPVSVTINLQQYIYFDFKTNDPPFNNMTVLVQTFTKNPNATPPAVFVANGYYPNASRSQFNSTATSHRNSLVILDPPVGLWSIAILGRDKNSLILTVQVNMDDVCFSKCSSNGKCKVPDKNGYVSCDCYDDFTGEYCQEYTNDMKNSTGYSGYVSIGFWSYWHFNITTDGGMSLVLTVSSVGAGNQPPNIYTQLNAHPSLSKYICAQPSLDLMVYKPVLQYTCTVNDKSMLTAGSTWYIGILGTEVGFGNYTITANFHSSDISLL